MLKAPWYRPGRGAGNGIGDTRGSGCRSLLDAQAGCSRSRRGPIKLRGIHEAWRTSSSNVDEPACVADADGVGAVLCAELVEQIGDVELRGLGGSADLDGDLLVRQSLPYQMEHFSLAWSEALQLRQRAGQLAGHERGEIGAAGTDGAYRGGELVGARVLEEVALGAGAQSLQHQFVLSEAGDDDCPGGHLRGHARHA